MIDTTSKLDASIERDIAAIARISAVPSLLRVICDFTGMGFAAVARVTESNWTACAVQDNINFGIGVGSQLPIETTLCNEARLSRQAVVIDHASLDPMYRGHQTPRIYGVESYVSVPIVRRDGAYFGNLFAVDPKPANVSPERIRVMFDLFAELIALQLESEDRLEASQSALIDARTASELREQFIAVLGHDLRNPLSAVTAAAELLTRRESEPEGVKIGHRLRSVSRRMTGLLDDVMDFARGRLGNGIGAAPMRVDQLGAALVDVIDELRDAHPQRVVTDRIDLPVPVWCDRGRVQQLLSNLLANALAHGAGDEPVTVRAAMDRDDLVLSVANGGEPIPPAVLHKVFEPYWRPSTRKPSGGLGLGLYICSQIAKAHGGRIDVTSNARDGTEFVVSLPAVRR